jgi:S-adenosylmethionine hydrolase
VDPGVGGLRHPVIVKTAKYSFIGPDNGIFSYIIQNEGYSSYIIQTDRLKQILGYDAVFSDTFHGRDIFAPAAALLSRKTDIAKLGQKMSQKIDSIPDMLEIQDKQVKAGILTVDRFGNIVTEFRIHMLDRILKSEIDEIRFKDHIFHEMEKTYSSAEKGKPLALWGSSGFLEIAVNQGSAVNYFNPDITRDRVEIRLK